MYLLCLPNNGRNDEKSRIQAYLLNYVLHQDSSFECILSLRRGYSCVYHWRRTELGTWNTIKHSLKHKQLQMDWIVRFEISTNQSMNFTVWDQIVWFFKFGFKTLEFDSNRLFFYFIQRYGDLNASIFTNDKYPFISTMTISRTQILVCLALASFEKNLFVIEVEGSFT